MVIVAVIAFGGLNRKVTDLTAQAFRSPIEIPYSAPLSAASDTYTVCLSATTNAEALPHSSCHLSATDAVGRV